LRALEEVAARYPNEKQQCAFAILESALILCSLGKPDQARNAIAWARNLFQQHSYFQTGECSLILYVPELVEGNYLAASQVLLADSNVDDGNLGLHAEQAIKAGIMQELGNHKDDARKVWSEAARRYPAERCCFYGMLANMLLSSQLSALSIQLEEKNTSSLIHPSSFTPHLSSDTSVAFRIPNSEFDISKMPFHPHIRSEMFYLVGLLCEKRGQMEQGKALFQMSVKEDATLRWPAYLSKKRLGEKQS
jgi:hypothetical protein